MRSPPRMPSINEPWWTLGSSLRGRSPVPRPKPIHPYHWARDAQLLSHDVRHALHSCLY